MRAYVLGATGFTGREVVRLLAVSGHQVIAQVRPDSSRLEEWRNRFTTLGARVDTTALTSATLAAELQAHEPDCVFALLGTTRRRGRAAARHGHVETYESVDYGLTARVIDAAATLRLKPRLVYLSAMGASMRSRSAYYRARSKTEEYLKTSGLPYTIARPSIISGPDRDDDRPLERWAARITDGALIAARLIGARRVYERYRSTTNSILAAALVRLALDPTAANRIVESEGLRHG